MNKSLTRIGERRQMQDGSWYELIQYETAKKVTIRNLDNNCKKITSYHNFQIGKVTGKVINNTKTKNMIGQVKMQQCGEKCKVIAANSWNDITVQFESGLKKHSNFYHFRQGDISNEVRNEYNIGTELQNKFGIKYKIVARTKHGNHVAYQVRFEDGEQKEVLHKFIKDVSHPDFKKNGAMNNFHGYSGSCVKIDDEYWHVVDGLGLITAREILDKSGDVI